MGYTTDFSGKCKIAPALNPAQIMYLRKFNETRRMKRDADKCANLADPIRKFVSLPVGEEGGYFVGGTGFHGQTNDVSVVNHNEPPKGQPSLWCQWTVTEDGEYLEWDGGEKFYSYVEWLNYLIEHFFKPWGCTLNGEIGWKGEDRSDRGTIFVKDNEVQAIEKKGKVKTTILNDEEKYQDFIQSVTFLVRDLFNRQGVGEMGDDEAEALKNFMYGFFSDKREDDNT
jgi:hypothetical protein